MRFASAFPNDVSFYFRLVSSSPQLQLTQHLENAPINFTFKSSNYASQIVLIRRRTLQATKCGLQTLVSWHLTSAGPLIT